jgi:hypothetical protein
LFVYRRLLIRRGEAKMAALRVLFMVVVAASALGIGAFLGGSIAQPALLSLMPWHSPQVHIS